jgi:capsular polysaccharide biosynthesis protein
MEERIYEDEISLKELIMALVNNWKIIVSITLIFAILAGGYVFLIADEVYETVIDGTISIPESTSTRYGTYSFPTTDKMDYLNVAKSYNVVSRTIENLGLENATVEGFSNSISIMTEDGSTRFSIRVTGPSPEEAVERVRVLVANFLNEITIMNKERAITAFIIEKNVNNLSLEESRYYNEVQLTQLIEEFEDVSPVITLQKLVTSDPVYAAEVARERGIRIESLSDEMMLEEVINPHYSDLQGEMISVRKELQSIDRSIDRNNKHLEELREEQEAVVEYLLTGDDSSMSLDVLDVIESRIQFAAHPSYKPNVIEPRKMMTLAIAIVLGGMIGVFVAFFKEYWDNN